MLLSRFLGMLMGCGWWGGAVGMLYVCSKVVCFLVFRLVVRLGCWVRLVWWRGCWLGCW